VGTVSNCNCAYIYDAGIMNAYVFAIRSVDICYVNSKYGKYLLKWFFPRTKLYVYTKHFFPFIGFITLLFYPSNGSEYHIECNMIFRMNWLILCRTSTPITSMSSMPYWGSCLQTIMRRIYIYISSIKWTLEASRFN
jgi:hypothetical protein